MIHLKLLGIYSTISQIAVFPTQYILKTITPAPLNN